MGDTQHQDVKKRKLRHIIRELAESTTLHGIPKIATAEKWYQRSLWTLAFLVTTGYVIFQLSELTATFLSRPIKTKMSLQFENLQFPAISICNMNPIKKSLMSKASPKLRKIIDPTATQENTSSAEQSSNMTDFWSYWEQQSDFLGNASVQNSTDYYYYDTNEEIEAPKSAWQARIQKFKAAYVEEDRFEREIIGHLIKDMLISCTYATKVCSYLNFTHFASSVYGNCFTISEPYFVVKRPGPLHGMWLTLNLESSEYLTNFVTGYGIRLVIHEPGTYPFPEEEGITLSPAFETSIGLKMIKLSRLAKPYSKCDDGKEFKEIFKINYTTTACQQLCIFYKVIDECECFFSLTSLDLDTAGEDIVIGGKKIGYCTALKDVECSLKVEDMLTNGTNDCSCEIPCRNIVYDKTISGRAWPNEEYLRHVLMEKMCKNLEHSVSEECKQYKNNTERYDVNRSKNNFLRVIIYYEDLNYQFIEEEPLYDVYRFLSDVGGTMGLFIGASVLSLLEVIQLVIEIVDFLCRHKKTKVRTIQFLGKECPPKDGK